MNKMGKKFIALLVVFTSIISFLPMEFGHNGQAANAVAAETSIEVRAGSTVLSSTTSGKDIIYSTQDQVDNFFVLVNDLRITSDSDLKKVGDTGIRNQEVLIKKINGISITDTEKLGDMGTQVVEAQLAGQKKLGVKIINLPLGVNKIEYSVRVTTARREATPGYDSSSGIADPGVVNQANDTVTEDEATTITIEHGNGIVQSKIKSIEFTNYIDGRNLNTKDNKSPFEYSKIVKTGTDLPLRYINDIPISVTDLDYTIRLANGIISTDPTDKDAVYIDGKDPADELEVVSDASGTSMKGSLTKSSQSTMIVLAIKHKGAIEHSFSIEVQYNNKLAKEDYTLRDAGITKLNYNESSGVEALIGKHFDVDTSDDAKDDGFETYEGTITIDKQAGMISMEPEIGRNSSDTAFKISNHYDSGGIQESVLIDGKQYVDFAKGSQNEIWLDIYSGSSGNATGGILARYKLKVTFADGSATTNVNLSFDDAYLTQPGKEGKIDFNVDRRSYDLHSNDKVKVNLVSPSTDANEYMKVWTGSSVSGDSVTEVGRSTGSPSSITVDVSKAKKIIVQAYYDGEDGTSYPIGYKYTFYIAQNADNPGNPGDGETSSANALLSGLKVSNGTLKDTDGSSGFSSDTYEYKVTVPKDDTSSKITATAQDSNAKSITATIVETSDEYDLTSGESFELSLNNSGKTTVKIVVTAEDGITTKTYNVIISNDTRSSSAKLKDVFLNVGDFTFNPDDDTTKVRVDQNVTSIKVTPVPEESKAKITVDGDTFDGTPVTVSLKGSQKTDIDIKVTSEDGSESKTYTLEVYRTDSDLDDGDDDDDGDDIFYDDIDDCWVDTSKYEEWGKVNGKQIYFNNKGRQVKNAWISTNGILYYLGSKGYKESGWKTETDGKSYYLDPSTGEMRKGWIYQNNSWYYLGLNGVMQKGWLYLNGKWYYFTPNGQLIANQSMYIDGKVYNFAQDGTMY